MSRTPETNPSAGTGTSAGTEMGTGTDTGVPVNGLANLGNTCYMNSCIQVLLRCEGLNAYLEEGTYKRWLKNQADSLILVEWDNLRRLMNSHTNCTIAPNAFLNAVQKVAEHKDRDLFTGLSQNDMPEFLLFFMDCIHTAVSREVDMRITGTEMNVVDRVATLGYQSLKAIFERDYSEMVSMFYCMNVTLINEVDCPADELLSSTLSIKCDPVFMIDAPLPMAALQRRHANGEPVRATMDECIQAYCSEETLTGDNGWRNEKTGETQDVKRRTLFWSLPEYMIVDIKRFNNRMQKLSVPVDVPLRGADFSGYVCGYNRTKYVYDVYGVIMHMGNVGGGHYVCNVLGGDGVWRQMNDTRSRVIDEAEVIDANAYCIFYRRVGS